MDFASMMSSAMSKSAKPPAASTSSSKYQRRAAVEAEREAAYRASQEATASAAAEKASLKRKADEEEATRAAAREDKKRKLAEASKQRREDEERAAEAARRKRLGLPALPHPQDGVNAASALAPDEEDISDTELRPKLRALAEPVTLFAETHAQRLRRYRALTRPRPKLTDGPIPTTLEPVAEADMKIPDSTPAPDTPERALLLRQLASYFSLLLVEWRRTLDARPAAVKAANSGRQAEAAMETSRENLRPLFKLLETGTIETPMLEAVASIVRAAQARRYVDANDRYLELSIGKAAWPIGVVSVGIHERASRSRIGEESKSVAHIMGDEVSRRWLQAIKRCITFAQTRWPPDDQMQLMG